MKLGLGVKVIWPATSDTVPFSGLPTAVTVSASPSGSVSLPTRSAAAKTRATSSLVERVSSSATGASLRAATLTVTVPVSLPPLPSETV